MSALEAAHVRGIGHRDIKPDTSSRSRSEHARRDPHEDPRLRIAKLMARGPVEIEDEGRRDPGSPAYMAPSQCKGGIEVDARGISTRSAAILFELSSVGPPFAPEGDG